MRAAAGAIIPTRIPADNPTRRFLPAAALAFPLLLLPYLMAACSGCGAAATIYPPLTATPAPTYLPATPVTVTPTLEPPAEPLLPPQEVAFTQITTGKHHACGLRENATALC